MLTRDRLETTLARAPSLRIAVLGDFFLDKYLVLDPHLAEVSLETARTAHQVVAVRCSPGAAGTVTSNLAALGVGRIEALGVVGLDGEGDDLLRGLHATGVRSGLLERRPDLRTPTYMKPMRRDEDGETETERIDIKNRAPLPGAAEAGIVHRLRALFQRREVDAVIVADQVQERNHGAVTDLVRDTLAALADAHPDVVLLADSRLRIGEFRNVCIKPNRSEASAALGAPAQDSLDETARTGVALAAQARRTAFVTVGPHGIVVCEPDGRWTHVPARPASGPIDIVGAGDSTTAGIVAALCAGASAPEAAAMGNLCASVTIRKLATTGTASPDELRAMLAAPM